MELPSTCRSREEFVATAGGPASVPEPGGDAVGAGWGRGQRLLAAVQEGRVLGALLAAIVVVRLPAPMARPPTAAKDPDEGLSTQR